MNSAIDSLAALDQQLANAAHNTYFSVAIQKAAPNPSPEVNEAPSPVSIQDLMKRVLQPVADIGDLTKTLDTLAFRSRRERKLAKDRLAALGDGTIFSILDVFKMKEAWNTGFPTVAIAPCGSSHVHFKTGLDGDASLNSGAWKMSIGRNPNASAWYEYSGNSPVPLVPKSLMPWNPLVRRNLHILFDVPTWTNKKVEMVDPYLLERLGKQRFRVLAHWDLSQKERQIMALLQD
jgi:hypothetical protein